MSVPQFVSEDEIKSIKDTQQKEWEQTRSTSDPLERPEEAYDPRTLYERLQEQKMKKVEEREEKMKLKNQIYRGLDDEEFEFLKNYEKEQDRKDRERAQEEAAALSEFRRKTAALNKEKEKKAEELLKKGDGKVFGFSKASLQKATKAKQSQMHALQGMIRRKGETTKEKENDGSTVAPSKTERSEPGTKKAKLVAPQPTEKRTSAKGLVGYDSSGSDDDSSDSD